MSRVTNATQKQAPIEDYAVGYKRPPKEHRFHKGVSGNPKGRPRMANNECLYEETVKRLATKEAYRLFTVHEGGKAERIPGIQAALRTMLMQGLKGKSQMLRAFLNLVIGIEGKRRQEQIEDVVRAFKYKDEARSVREKCAKEGVPAPEFVPDPDHIHIDTENGTVTATGPVTREQKEEYDRLAEIKKSYETEVEEIKALLVETPDDQFLLNELASVEKVLKTLKAIGL